MILKFSLAIAAAVIGAIAGFITHVFFSLVEDKHEPGYVIEDQNGTQVVCKNAVDRACGVFASNCEDGAERNCMTNVKIRKVEP
jgi:hypothetical protein